MKKQADICNPQDYTKQYDNHDLPTSQTILQHEHHSTFKLLNMCEQLYHKKNTAFPINSSTKKHKLKSRQVQGYNKKLKEQKQSLNMDYQMIDRYIPSRKVIRQQFHSSTSNPDNIYNQQNYNKQFINVQDPQTITVSEIYSRQLLRNTNSSKNQHNSKYEGFKDNKSSYDDNIDMELFYNRNLFRYKIKYSKDPFSGAYICSDSMMLPLHRAHQYKKNRKISKNPYKVLDAPALTDDFYLNLIAWSNKNILAVGLGNCIYLWDAVTTKVTRLCELPNDSITSVCWSNDTPQLAIGCNQGHVLVWDIEAEKQTRKMQGHEVRVGAMSWSNKFLSTGSRDKTILQRDLRLPRNYTLKLQQHTQQICGLKWSGDQQYLASGGNDNKVIIWNQNGQVINKFNDHRAAVKALAWSPHKHGLLATGGGTADRMIKLRNIFTSQILFSEDTGSQVCNLQFSKSKHQLVSTHGYSQNQVNIWQYPHLKRIATLRGHTHRVLYLAISPDGSQIVTGAGDETLRFWNVFPKINDSTIKISSPLEIGEYDVR